MHLPRHHVRVAGRSGRAGRSRPDAGRDGGAVLHRQRSRRARRRLEGGGGAAAVMRLAALRDLAIPCRSICGSTGWRATPSIILVRILGGYDWWRYGCDRLSAVARERGIKLALLPGECRDRDERLIDAFDLARRRTRSAARLFPRGRAGQYARAGAPAGRPCRRRDRCKPRQSRCRRLGSTILRMRG